MQDACNRPFDETLLTGHLDGALPQSQAQRVRLHLEDCPTCRSLIEEMTALRETALSTHFVQPKEDRWPELPQTRASWLGRFTGWTLLIAWLLVVSGLALWNFISQTGDPLEIFLVLGLPGAFALLFLSVLIDRLRDLENDRYRGIHR